ncbi:putative transporter C02C2.4 [Toxocara canis]|uniref:Putative transporter C02C2.4 n=1 Tax=Toxocara canis TaxID=6265 RepID=A0A0B2VDP1_TOXCA|nr:putative transporter C02C2.4 [Toxocara canis]
MVCDKDSICKDTMMTSEKKPHTALFHYRSLRLYIGLLLMCVFFCTVSMRTNLGMAMVCMVNATAFSSSVEHIDMSLESDSSKSICTQREVVFGENSTAMSEAGYNGHLLWSPGMQSALYSATFYGSIVTILISGYLADRYGPKYLLFLAMCDYIVVTLLTPVLAEFNYYAFFVARVIMGFGEGFMVPTMASIAGVWFPPMERSTMAGMYTSGNQLAGTFGVLISSKLCEVEALGGWYSIFYIFGKLNSLFLNAR